MKDIIVKTWILLMVVALFMSSCGTFKKVLKLKDTQRTEAKSEVKLDSSVLRIDKTITTIKEKTDTTVTTKVQVVKQDTYINQDSLIKGMTAIQNDLVDVRLTLDPATGILSAVATVKPQSVHLGIDKTTIIEADVKEDLRVAKLKNESLKKEAKYIEINKEPAKMGIWLAITVFIIIVLAVFYFFRKR